MHYLRTLFISLSLVLPAPWVTAGQSFDLPALERFAWKNSPELRSIREIEEGARFGLETAAAYPNPEFEFLQGSAKSRGGLGQTQEVKGLAVTQPLDLPYRRQPRMAAAEAGLVSAKAESTSLQADFLARLRLQFFTVLRREAELRNASEDARLVEGAKSRIEMRVSVGESPRFELVKANAEALNAQKNVRSAEHRVAQARSALRQVVGDALPHDFVLHGRLDEIPEIQAFAVLRTEIAQNNPEIARSRAEVVRARAILDAERALRLPSVALKATQDQDSELKTSQYGLVINIPIWDQRAGPIGEASSALARRQHALEAQGFALEQSIDIAIQQYEIALAQVKALESGIVHQAESALHIAEAAYRFGERGFLEVLDAQRVYRAARVELVVARYELAAAWVELERLRAVLGNP